MRSVARPTRDPTTLDNSHTARKRPIGIDTALLIAAAAAASLVAIVLASFWRQDDVSVFLRDPAATFEFPPLAGLVSHLGVFAMIASAAVCLFVAWLTPAGNHLLLWVGLFTLYIALDDFFMLHEELLPAQVGIPEVAVLGGIGLAALAIALSYWRDLLGREHAALYLAVGLLAASVGVDLLVRFSTTSLIVEDGFKFAGLCTWSAYWISRARTGLDTAAAARIAR